MERIKSLAVSVLAAWDQAYAAFVAKEEEEEEEEDIAFLVVDEGRDERVYWTVRRALAGFKGKEARKKKWEVAGGRGKDHKTATIEGRKGLNATTLPMDHLRVVVTKTVDPKEYILISSTMDIQR